MKVTLVTIGILVGIFLLGWAIEGNNFFMYKVFAPKIVEVQREVFENGKPYKEGMIRDLQDLYLEYNRCPTEVQKKGILGMVRHRFADFPTDKVPVELREFVRQAKYGN